MSALPPKATSNATYGMSAKAKAAMWATGTTAEIAGYTGHEVSAMRASFVLLVVMLTWSSSVRAAPYDPYPWCAVYGGSWSGSSNCGFKTLQQCMATVSGIGGSCEPNQFASPVASVTKTSAKPYWAIRGSDGGAAGRGSRMRSGAKGSSSKESDIGSTSDESL